MVSLMFDDKEARQRCEREGYLWDPVASAPVHRSLARRLLDRNLDEREEVHHIDHVKTNNDPKNLILLTHEAHMMVHVLTLFHPRVGAATWRDPASLIDWLKRARIQYDWLGDHDDSS